MQGKKRYLALILFIVIGLIGFTFANPNEELEPVDSNVKKVTENKPEKEAEKAVEKAELRPSTETVEEAEEIIEESVTLNPVVRQELTERLEVVEEAIDASELVATVERMVEESEDKDDILASEIYFNDNDVEVITGNMDPGDVKDNLEDRIDTLIEIFEDEEAPTISGIESGVATKKDVQITIEDNNKNSEVTINVTLNDEKIDFADTFDKEGVYVINVVDAAHNPATLTFTIDKTNPKFTNIKSGGHYSSIDEIVVDDATETTINIKNNDNGATGLNVPLTEDATYLVTATDKAGNSKAIYVAIDNTNPEIISIDGEVTKSDVKVTIKDKFLMNVTINDKKYNRDDFKVQAKNENFSLEYDATEEGVYTINAVDKKGNPATKTFTIDKTTPKFENLASREVDIEYYKVDITDATDTVITLQKNHGTWIEIEEGYELTEEATYQLKAVDAAGNTYTTWIHIDKTAPEIYGVEKEYYNTCVNISAFDRYLNTVTIDDVKYGRKSPVPFVGNGQNENFTFTAPEAVCGEGKHTIVAKDKAGKETKVEFTIDTKNPMVEGVNNNYYYNKPITIKTIRNTSPIKSITIDDKPYEEGTEYFEEGEHLLVAYDMAGNRLRVKFTMDKTNPIVVGVNNKYYYNKPITITTIRDIAPIKSATIDDKPYELGTEYFKEGEHLLVIYDMAGNRLRVKFTMDEKAPTVTPSYTKKTVEGDKNGEFKDYPTFEVSDNFDKELKKEVISEKVDITKVGVYELKYKFTDDAGNTTEVVIPVSVVDTTPAKLTLPFPIGKETYEYRIESGTKVELDEIAATLTDNIDENGRLKPTSADLLIGTKYENTYGYNLENGINTKHAGRYELRYEYEDSSKNKSKITLLLFMKDTIKPELTITKENDKVFVKGEDVTKLTFKITKGDEEVLVVTDKTEFEITDLARQYGDGIFKVTLTDAGKNSVSKEVEIDLNAPVVEIDKTELTIEEDSVKEFKEEDHLTIKVTDASDKVKKEVTGTVDTTQYGKYTLEYKFTDNVGNSTTKTVVVNVVDTKNPTIDNIEEGKHYKIIIPEVKDKHLKNTYYKVSYLDDKVSAVLPYKEGSELNVYGNYELTAIDESGNQTTKKFVVDPIKPQILLLEELKVIRGDLIPIKPVIIEPNIDTITVTLNGRPYEYNLGDQLTEHGEYVITVKDKAGNEESSTFNMDNQAPVLIEPIMGGVYKDVKVTMLEENINEDAIVLLKKTRTEKVGKLEIPIYEKVEYKYGDTISEEGQYYVVVADQALNVSYAKFTIDRTPPTSNLVEGKVYNEVTPEIYEDNVLVSKIFKDGRILPIDYTEGDTIDEPGAYKLYVLDAALNDPLEVNFKIDGYAAPTIALENEALESNTAEVYETLMSTTKLNVRGIASDNITKYTEETKYVTPTITKYLNSVQEGEAFTANELDVSQYGVSYDLTWKVLDEAGNEGTRTLKINVVNITHEIRFDQTATYTSVYNGQEVAIPKTAKLYKIKQISENEIEETELNEKIEYSVDKTMKDAGTYTITAKYGINTEKQQTYTITPKELVVSFENLEGRKAMLNDNIATYKPFMTLPEHYEGNEVDIFDYEMYLLSDYLLDGYVQKTDKVNKITEVTTNWRGQKTTRTRKYLIVVKLKTDYNTNYKLKDEVNLTKFKIKDYEIDLKEILGIEIRGIGVTLDS